MPRLNKEDEEIRNHIIRQLKAKGSFTGSSDKKFKQITKIIMTGKNLYKGQEKSWKLTEN